MRRRTARRAVAALAATSLLAMLWVAIAASAQDIETYADDFDPVGYGGDDGSLSWDGPWVEVGESDGADSGAARVKKGSLCATEACIELGTFVGSDGVGLRRSLDLRGAASATLTYTYHRVKKAGGGAVVVSAAPSVAGPWTEVARHPFVTTDAVGLPALADLTGFVGGTVVIRFSIEGDEVKSRVGIDDLVVTTVSAVATTTTEPEVTTTTEPEVTTTTEPEVTTTTEPEVTTTTEPQVTTTTEPQVTTTTEPQVTTTTRAPSATTTTTRPSAATTTTIATTTTTTTPGEETVVTTPPGPSDSTVLPTAGRMGDRPTEGIAMAVSLVPESAGADGTSPRPLARFAGAVSTAVANVSTPHVAYALLAVVVAWAGITGLDHEARRSRGLRGRRPRYQRRRR